MSERNYKIYIDENLPSQLAKGLNILQQPMNAKENWVIEVMSIKEVFGQGEKDEEWIVKIGKDKNAIVITQDYRIQSLKHQRELYKANGIGILFISPPSKNGFAYWELVKLLTERWDEIKTIIRKNKPPFGFRCSSRKGFERLDD